jgi:hypothetical protein
LEAALDEDNAGRGVAKKMHASIMIRTALLNANPRLSSLIVPIRSSD